MNYWSEANQFAIPYARPAFPNRAARASHSFQTMKLQCRQYHSISWVTEEVKVRGLCVIIKYLLEIAWKLCIDRWERLDTKRILTVPVSHSAINWRVCGKRGDVGVLEFLALYVPSCWQTLVVRGNGHRRFWAFRSVNTTHVIPAVSAREM